MIGRAVLKHDYILSVGEPVTDHDDVACRIDETAELMASHDVRKVLIDSTHIYDIWSISQIPDLVELVRTRLPATAQLAFVRTDHARNSKFSQLVEQLRTGGVSAALFKDQISALAWLGISVGAPIKN
jgi:hypothetical protein